MTRKNWDISAGSRVDSLWRSVVADPLMVARGARSSCPIMPKTSARSRSISASGAMSWAVTTTESTEPSAERMGVALTIATMLRPSANSTMNSSSRTTSPEARPSKRVCPFGEITRPSARR